MNKDRIWTLLSRKLSGEATQAELLELQDLLGSEHDINAAAATISEFWHVTSEADSDYLEATYHLHNQKLIQSGHNINSIVDDIAGQMEMPQSRRPKRMILMVAAFVSILLSVIVARFLFAGGDAEAQATPSEVSTKNGSRSKITLPDGTQVWLNSNSKIIYDNENFGKLNREVTLTGEAYFDVVKNPAKPFVIHTSKINIKVLGTVFNVKAYPEDKQTETSLIHGSIEVTVNNRPGNKIILAPSEKLLINNFDENKTKQQTTKATKVESAVAVPQVAINKLVYNKVDSTVAETAWVNNRLVFRDESLEEVAVKMQRWYNTQIEIQDTWLAKQRINVTFETETITQALDALAFSTGFKHKQQDNKFFIYR
jgi:transmembrane sensor